MAPEYKKYFFIGIRAMLMVCFATTSIWTIANQMYLLAIIVGVGISTMMAVSVSDLAVCTRIDRFSYVLGGALGTTSSLYLINPYLEYLIV